MGAGHQIGECPDEEHQTRQRPGQYGETEPFGKFAQVVGAGHIVEHESLRQVVIVVIVRLAQVANDVVGAEVDEEPEEEYDRADYKLRRF